MSEKTEVGCSLVEVEAVVMRQQMRGIGCGCISEYVFVRAGPRGVIGSERRADWRHLIGASKTCVACRTGMSSKCECVLP